MPCFSVVLRLPASKKRYDFFIVSSSQHKSSNALRKKTRLTFIEIVLHRHIKISKDFLPWLLETAKSL